jgi:hypothetical protein
MARDYYYEISTELLEDVTPLQVVQMWDPDAKANDLFNYPTGEVTWEESNGPAFTFSNGGRFLEIIVDTEAHHGFNDEFEHFLIDLAERVVGGAFVSIEGEERQAEAYGQDPAARKAALVAYRKVCLADARKRLLALDPRADSNEDGVLDLIVRLKALLEEAIEDHIYANDDARPDDCSFLGGVAAAQKLLSDKGR